MAVIRLSVRQPVPRSSTVQLIKVGNVGFLFILVGGRRYGTVLREVAVVWQEFTTLIDISIKCLVLENSHIALRAKSGE